MPTLRREDEIDKRAEEMFNSHPDLHDKETQAGSNYTGSGTDQAESYANDLSNSSIGLNTKEDEVGQASSDGFYNRNSSEKKSASSKIIGFTKSKKGAATGILGGLGIIGVLLSTAFGPFTLLHNLQANAVARNDSRSATLERRLVKMLEKKMGVDRDGPCDLSKAKCRMGKMPQKMLARLEAQGIKAFDGEKELDFSGGDEDNKGKYVEKNPSHYEFIDKDGNTKRIKSSEFVSEYKNNPVLRSTFKKAYNMRYYSWVGKTIRKIFYSKYNLSQGGGVDSNQPAVTEGEVSPEDESDTDKIREQTEERLKPPSSASDGQTLIKNRLSSMVERTIKKTQKTGFDPALTVGVGLCTAVNIPRFVAGTVRAIQVAQVVALANDLILSPAGKVKSGEMEPSSVSSIGDILTERPIVGGVPTPSALDSAILMSAIGVNKSKVKITKDSAVPGYGAYRNGFTNLTSGISASTQSACNKIASPQAALVSGAISGAITAGTGGVGGVVIAALKGAGKIAAVLGAGTAVIFILEKSGLLDEIAKIGLSVLQNSLGDYIEGAKGEKLGDALGVGLLSFFSLGSLSGGNAVLKKDQVADFSKMMGSVDEDYRQEAIATLSPFDISSPYTFMGNLVSTLNLNGFTNPSNILTATTSTLLNSPGSLLFPRTLAASDEVEGRCGYADMFDLDSDVAVNAAGYPCTGIPTAYLGMSTDDVYNRVASEIDENSGEPTDDGDISSMLADCAEGDLESISGCTIDATPATPTPSTGEYNTKPTEEEMSNAGLSEEEKEKIRNGTPNTTPAQSKTDKDRAALSLYLADKQVSDTLDGSDEEEFSTGSGLNILSWNLCRKNASCSDESPISANERSNLNTQVFEEQLPDIAGIQEADEIADKLKKSSTVTSQYGLFESGTRSILWNTKYFDKKAVETGKFNMSAGRDDMPWVKLQSTSGTSLYVVNIHAKVDEGGPGSSSSARKEDGEKTVELIRKKMTDAPVVIVGDMNSQYPGHDSGGKGNEIYNAFTAAGYELAINEAAEKINDNCQTAHGYKEDCGGKNASHIDQIWTANMPGATVNSWELIKSDVTQKASDHRPIKANISIPGIFANQSAVSGKFAWPLGENHWKSNKGDYKKGHTSTGTAWGDDAMGTNGKGAGIATDLGAAVGTPVYAMFGGKVTSVSLCGSNDGMAIKSEVDGGTLGVAYMHGRNKKFKVGDTVQAGQQIMEVGVIGCNVNGAHLHIGMAYNGKYICPQDVFISSGGGSPINFADLTKKGVAPCNRTIIPSQVR